MIVSQLQIYNFRRFRSMDGKTAIIDALKLVLLTQSNEYIRPAEDDFYID